ncbi:MAG: hypothetical protein AAFU61_08500, partial [Pseudomonadota bacterium]
LNRAGVVGDASAGTAETGAALAAHQAQGFAELLAEMAAVDLESFAAFGDATGGQVRALGGDGPS